MEQRFALLAEGATPKIYKLPINQTARLINEVPTIKILRPLLAIYGSGIAGTFAWLFSALSGAAACASGTEPCRVVVGLTGQLALVWPAYWGSRISGNATMTPIAAR